MNHNEILKDPVKKASLILSSTLQETLRLAPCRSLEPPGEGAWLTRYEASNYRIEVLAVNGAVVAAIAETPGGIAEGSRALELIARADRCVAEVFKVDLDQLPYRAQLLEAARAREPPYSWIGSTLHGYRVESVIGEGAFSYVLKAHGSRGSVALKVLKPGPAGDAGKVYKFRMEALLQASLSGVDDETLEAVAKASGSRIGVLKSGRRGVVSVYMVYVPGPVKGNEYVEDPPVIALELMNGPVNAQTDPVSVASSVARALTLAHSMGYGHFDLKPGNVLVKNGEVKLADFSGYTRTPAGFIVDNVTPAYTDPLLIAVRGVGVGLDSDVYNYYTLLLRIATGRHPLCTLTLNSFLLAAMTGGRPKVPRDAPQKLVESLASAAGGDPGSLIEAGWDAYTDCIRGEVEGLAKVLGGEWRGYALKALSLDRDERPGSMLDNAVPGRILG